MCVDEPEAVALCIYCNARPVDPAWGDYCGAHCCLEAEFDSVTSFRSELGKAVGVLERARKADPCRRKIKHVTEEAAEQHARALVNRGVAGDLSRLHVYLCPRCGGYHVGH